MPSKVFGRCLLPDPVEQEALSPQKQYRCSLWRSVNMGRFAFSFRLATAARLWASLRTERTRGIQEEPRGRRNPSKWLREWDRRGDVVCTLFRFSALCFGPYPSGSRDRVFGIRWVCDVSPLSSGEARQSSVSHPREGKISSAPAVCSAGLVLHTAGVCKWQRARRILSSPTQQIIYSNFINEFSLLFLPCELLRKPRVRLQCICKVVSASHLRSGGVWKSFLVIHTCWFVLTGHRNRGGYFCPLSSLGWSFLISTNTSFQNMWSGTEWEDPCSVPVGRGPLDRRCSRTAEVLASNSQSPFQEYSLTDAWNSLPLPVFLPGNVFIWVITQSKHEKGMNPDKNILVWRWSRWCTFHWRRLRSS